MIEVIYSCIKCGYTKGNIFTWDRTIEVECQACGSWETMRDETSDKKYLEVTYGGKLKVGKER